MLRWTAKRSHDACSDLILATLSGSPFIPANAKLRVSAG